MDENSIGYVKPTIVTIKNPFEAFVWTSFESI